MEEMNVLKQQVNFALFHDLMAFIMETTKAGYAQASALHERCVIPFSDRDNGVFQKKYGFMYLGELLERYEERFEMALPDFRAIALALGYTKDLTPDDMFVGTQRVDFLKKIQRAAASDIYLTGALYLLYEGQSDAGQYEAALCQTGYEKTEEILFAMSLFPNTEDYFLRLKPVLLHLIGKKRSIPVLGNMMLFARLISWLRPLVKSIRTKDMALFRALCALPVSFVKTGDKNYELLSKVGYTPLEIAYANMQAVWLSPIKDRLNWSSIVTEKILVELFREVFRSEESLPGGVYEQLSEWLKKYEKFPIKCYGQEKLLAALDYGEKIRNLETFRWFSAHANFTHGAFQGFDIMDDYWDGLAVTMEFPKYTELFEAFLHDELSTEDIQARINRFNLLTGQDYIEYGGKRHYWYSFSMLVAKNVIELWQVFQNSIDANGAPVKHNMLKHIGSVLRGMTTIQAFRFYESFLPQYGFEGLNTYFDNAHLFRDSVSSCAYNYGRSANGVKLELNQDYLNDDMRRLLLYWLSEYFFRFETEFYLPLIAEILNKKEVAGLFPANEQRAMFDLAMAHPTLVSDFAERLRARYWTEEEKAAQQAKNEALQLEHERQKQREAENEVWDAFVQVADGTMASLMALMNQYKHHSTKSEIADAVVCETLLNMKDSRVMDETECVCLLNLCARLIEKKKMRFTEAQKLITMMKEVPYHEGTDSGSDAE